MVWNIFTQATRTRFSVATGPAVRCLTFWSKTLEKIWPLFSAIIFSKVVASGGADNDMKIFKASSGEVVKPSDTWCQGLETSTLWSWSSVLTLHRHPYSSNSFFQSIQAEHPDCFDDILQIFILCVIKTKQDGGRWWKRWPRCQEDYPTGSLETGVGPLNSLL